MYWKSLALSTPKENTAAAISILCLKIEKKSKSRQKITTKLLSITFPFLFRECYFTYMWNTFKRNIPDI